jgi:protein ImuB
VGRWLIASKKRWAIQAVHGPERIQTGWWENESIQRDYYRVQTTEQEDLWIYREPQGGIYLHGVFH